MYGNKLGRVKDFLNFFYLLSFSFKLIVVIKHCKDSAESPLYLLYSLVSGDLLYRCSQFQNQELALVLDSDFI